MRLAISPPVVRQAEDKMRCMKWFKISLLIQFVLAIYFETMIWFPVGAWNAQPGDRLITLVHGGHTGAVIGFSVAVLTPFLLFVLAFWRRWFWLMWVGLLGHATWAAMQIKSWWIPWLFGPSARDLANAKSLGKTYKIFPSSSRHLAPDAMHFVLDLLLFAALATLAAGLLRQSTETRKRRLP
jgi:hypothetical protein